VRTPRGEDVEVLDLVDWLANLYPRIYVVDLDGIERDRPQLDYLQEISKGCETWVDAGLRSGDQAIDLIVAGATRAVLSSSDIDSIKEVRRAWKLSPDIVFEVAVEAGRLRDPARGFAEESIRSVIESVRGLGITDLIWDSGTAPVDWGMVRSYASGGRLWVSGPFRKDDAPQLAQAGAAGGIFQIRSELDAWLQTLAGTREK
jgi:hypothetical protein